MCGCAASRPCLRPPSVRCRVPSLSQTPTAMRRTPDTGLISVSEAGAMTTLDRSYPRCLSASIAPRPNLVTARPWYEGSDIAMSLVYSAPARNRSAMPICQESSPQTQHFVVALVVDPRGSQLYFVVEGSLHLADLPHCSVKRHYAGLEAGACCLWQRSCGSCYRGRARGRQRVLR